MTDVDTQVSPAPTATLPPVVGKPSVPLDPELARKISAAAKRVQENTARRDELIREAITAGASLRAVAEVAGLSHTQVRNISTRPVADDTSTPA